MYLNISHSLPNKLNSSSSVCLFFFGLDVGCCFGEAVVVFPSVVSVEDEEQTEDRALKASVKNSEICC